MRARGTIQRRSTGSRTSPVRGATHYRLIGIGVSHLDEGGGDDLADMIDLRTAKAEHAVDALRTKFGRDAVVKGLAIEEE